jgi:hypothetical protein
LRAEVGSILAFLPGQGEIRRVDAFGANSWPIGLGLPVHRLESKAPRSSGS